MDHASDVQGSRGEAAQHDMDSEKMKRQPTVDEFNDLESGRYAGNLWVLESVEGKASNIPVSNKEQVWNRFYSSPELAIQHQCRSLGIFLLKCEEMQRAQ